MAKLLLMKKVSGDWVTENLGGSFVEDVPESDGLDIDDVTFYIDNAKYDAEMLEVFGGQLICVLPNGKQYIRDLWKDEEQLEKYCAGELENDWKIKN